MIYFISDFHFGHNNMRRFERDQFQSIEEHDKFIIDRINKQVKPTDTLWILGDVGEPSKLQQINGYKHLILGNHDKRSVKEYGAYVHEVYTTPQYFGKRIVLSHEPIVVNNSTLNVHGHLHGSVLDSINHLNVSIHMVDYKVVNSGELNSLLAKLPLPNETFLEEWYAALYLFDRPRPDLVLDDDGKLLVEETVKLREKLYGGQDE